MLGFAVMMILDVALGDLTLTRPSPFSSQEKGEGTGADPLAVGDVPGAAVAR